MPEQSLIFFKLIWKHLIRYQTALIDIFKMEKFSRILLKKKLGNSDIKYKLQQNLICCHIAKTK